MVIVKLGGSLYQSPALLDWLNKLAELSQQQQILIVPGGGPFADQVRDAQSQYDFSETTAHHMALLAMSQFGLLLSDLNPCIQAFYYQNDQQSPDAELSVWLPDKSMLAEPALPHNWDITSDSLALWLAQQLTATKLSLIKHYEIEQPVSTHIGRLIETDLLDHYFATQYLVQPIITEIHAASSSNSFSLALPTHPLHHD